ncbi:unnamed protein product [Protopolystoma xenopodis]|uniref:Uncharacterized protein n=1 Tax=Protopolystoma xenopodis TaxID=117903 RepID=A0A3S5FGJ5_9PLAT|nr:unnamed protein product [Protopolystoma xenopodis]
MNNTDTVLRLSPPFPLTLRPTFNDPFRWSFEHKTEANLLPAFAGVAHGYALEYFFGKPFDTIFENSFWKFTAQEGVLSQAAMKELGSFVKGA